jgi:hypothetical protein
MPRLPALLLPFEKLIVVVEYSNNLSFRKIVSLLQVAHGTVVIYISPHHAPSLFATIGQLDSKVFFAISSSTRQPVRTQRINPSLSFAIGQSWQPVEVTVMLRVSITSPRLVSA